VTFEAGAYQLGGNSIYLAPQDIRLGKRESVKDAARNLSRWVDLIVARTFSHTTVVELAENGSVPVINGLSDLEHPCQALADFLTIVEHKEKLTSLKISWISDGNNVCNSFILCGALLGANLTCAIPEGYEPTLLKEAQKLAHEHDSTVELVRRPEEAARNADVIYTDVWVSMGEEEEAEKRKKVFAPYQINRTLTALAKPDHLVLHCLPAHRGEEITDEVLDGPNSCVLDQAENRLHIQKAIMAKLV
jgi:ornithine carbamoyltransferase